MYSHVCFDDDDDDDGSGDIVCRTYKNFREHPWYDILTPFRRLECFATAAVVGHIAVQKASLVSLLREHSSGS